MAEVRNLSAPGSGEGRFRCWLYRARMVEELPSQPCLVFFHGGGTLEVFGDLDTHDATYRNLANAAGVHGDLGGLPAGARAQIPGGFR